MSAGSSSLEKHTLPLWMIDDTSVWPSDSNVARSSAIGSRLWPPTLMPRNSATWCVTVVTVVATWAILPE